MALPSNFKVSEAVDEAFERIKFDPKKLTGEHIASARRSIRLMLDSWNNDSVDFFKVQSNIRHTLTLNEASFSPVAGTIDILDAGILRDSYLTPMVVLSRSDWFAIPDKAKAPGMPNRYWVERASATPAVHLYPYSENATDIVVYDAMIQYSDSTILAGSPDIPPRWNECFTAGLAAFLSKKFARDLHAELMREYGGPMFCSPPNTIRSAYEIARAGDRERGDTILIFGKSRRSHR